MGDELDVPAQLVPAGEAVPAGDDELRVGACERGRIERAGGAVCEAWVELTGEGERLVVAGAQAAL